MLKVGNELPRNSPLLNVSPFYDEEIHVIRVGGRLSQSNLDEVKFPYLISMESKLKMLLTRHYHETTLHVGGLLTLNTMSSFGS